MSKPHAVVHPSSLGCNFAHCFSTPPMFLRWWWSSKAAVWMRPCTSRISSSLAERRLRSFHKSSHASWACQNLASSNREAPASRRVFSSSVRGPGIRDIILRNEPAVLNPSPKKSSLLGGASWWMKSPTKNSERRTLQEGVWRSHRRRVRYHGVH